MVASTMRDIQPSLLHCDMLSTAQEALSLPDIFFSSQLQSALQLIEDKGHVELPEEFADPVPQEHRLQPKLSAVPQFPWQWSAESSPVRATPLSYAVQAQTSS